MTTEDDFHAALDAHPDDGHTRLVFADWLEEQSDPRAAGYRAIAVRGLYPHQARHGGKDAWWWHRASRAAGGVRHNVVPADWFALLPAGEGLPQFWPVLNDRGRVRTRRECEDELARAFAGLPAARRAELLSEPAETQE